MPGGLIAATRLLLTGVEERRALGRVLSRADLSPTIETSFRGSFLRVQGLFEAAFDRAAASGALHVGRDAPAALGRLFFLALHGLVDDRLRHPQDSPSLECDLVTLERCFVGSWFAAAEGQ